MKRELRISQMVFALTFPPSSLDKRDTEWNKMEIINQSIRLLIFFLLSISYENQALLRTKWLPIIVECVDVLQTDLKL